MVYEDTPEQRAADYFDVETAPSLRASGVPPEGLKFMRDSYIKGALASPEAMEQLKAWSDQQKTYLDLDTRSFRSKDGTVIHL